MQLKTSFALAVVLVLSGTASAQVTLESLVARNVAAHGGAEAIAAVQTVQQHGTIQAQGMDIPFKAIVKRPGMMRTEATVMGMSVVTAYDGEKAWMINPMTGSAAPAEVPAEQAASIREQTNFEPMLSGYAARGITVVYAGEEVFGGAPAHKLVLTMRDTTTVELFLDPETGLERGVIIEVTNPMTGKIRATTTFSDFRTVGGFVMPFKIETSADGQVMTSITFEDIKVNEPVDDAVFKING